MYAIKLAFKNVRARKSSLVIILFIAFAIALLVLSNAIFDGTDNGIEKTFVNSFTGNIVIRPESRYPLSLFGDETPVTGELSTIPNLIPYADILECVKNTNGIKETTSQISGAAALNIKGVHIAKALFGVNAEEYCKMMSGIIIKEGRVYASDEQGIMLSENSIEEIKKNTGVTLKIGDSVQLITANGTSFTIRSATLTGIYTYSVQNATLDRIALINPQILRDLMGTRDASLSQMDLEEDQIDLIESDIDLDDLFSDAEDFFSEESEPDELLKAFTEENELNEGKEIFEEAESSVWSYIICRTEDKASEEALINVLNYQFKKNEWPVQAINWRTSAGGTVYLIYYLRIIFNIGIILILATGFIVVNNTLTISSLTRVCETGTLRALGAKRNFIASQFFLETAFLTVTAGILGCILGYIINAILLKTGIQINNMYLAQLFGGSTLSTVITLKNIAMCMVLSVLLAFIGWFYPVYIALHVSPIEAMRGQI